ncbi:helix-turn-helix domain-containing protein [Jeotgalicoccus halotolerans]|uniref:Transposase n=2 Tax=Jeotgalicoccus halotolerans TaxID=157227 RepID=A0A3E0AWX6_9STAP|nr:transposase [Jeotgalicoccus halotolerans]
MKNNKHSFEFKLTVVTDYLNGEGGFQYLGKKYSIQDSLIKIWVTQYNQFGDEGLAKSMTHTHYSGEFKRAVLQYRQENQLSYRETAIHFGLKNSSMIANWQRKLLECGPAALDSHLGRSRKHMVKEDQSNNKTTNRDEPLNETEREELERLREQLRMSKLENIILKKLNALPKNPTDNK